MSNVQREKLSSLQGEVYRFSSWDNSKPEDLAYLSFSDLHHATGHETDEHSLFFLPELMLGSDYSGDSVTVANHRTFLRLFGEVSGVFKIIGSHGSYGVAVRLDVQDEDLWHTLEKLENYPCLDEEDLSTVEDEAQEEAWSGWVCSDFRMAIEDKFGELTLTEDALRVLFDTARETANECWENQTGNSAWIDIARVAAAVEPSDIAQVYGVPETVVTQVQHELESLREAAKHIQIAGNVGGRAAARAHWNFRIEQAGKTLAEFRKYAPANKVDAEAIITLLGGEPVLPAYSPIWR